MKMENADEIILKKRSEMFKKNFILVLLQFFIACTYVRRKEDKINKRRQKKIKSKETKG